MKLLTATFLCLLAGGHLFAQEISIDKIITPAAVGAVEGTLSGDSMRGRKVGTPDIERAADYIGSQFRKAGLKTWNGGARYRQPFSMIKIGLRNIQAYADGKAVPSSSVAIFSTDPQLSMNEKSGYTKAYIKAGDNLFAEARHYFQEKSNYIVLVDTSFTKAFPNLSRFNSAQFKSDRNIIFLLTGSEPAQYSIGMQQVVNEMPLANVVGILPGKSKKKEYVIFSGHYDHLGVDKPDSKGDSIYNGANDDASGTTAVILLADYFAKKHNNERTLVFAAFTAEEIGEFGSQYFSSQFNADSVMAMFNIEMIGTESKWGANSAFITGYERSDMAKILEKNLAGSPFKFYPDPYTDQNLFYRSDNASLARQGVPAHTISTFPIDTDPHYHTHDDDINHLDMKNMAQVIKAIALSSTSIVKGKDTPTRVDKSQVH